MQKACRVVHISVIPDPELPLTCPSPSQTQPRSKVNHQIPAGTVTFHFKIMQNSPGPDTVQLFADLYYMGETNLPEYPHMARRSP